MSDSLEKIPAAPGFHIKADSLYKEKAAVLKNGLKDSSLQQKINTEKKMLGSKSDSLKPAVRSCLQRQLDAAAPHGSVSAGYDYGVLPYVAGGGFPAGGYRTEGDVSFLVLGLPLKLTFHYTDIKNVIGLNNYFRISYDASRYKDQLSQKMSEKEKAEKEKLGNLQLMQQQVMQKIGYMTLLQQSPVNSFMMKDSMMKKPVAGGVQHPSMPGGNTYAVPDTSVQDNYPRGGYAKDSAAYVAAYMHKKDSVSNEIGKYRSRYDSLNNVVAALKKQIDRISAMQKDPTGNNPYLSKYQNVLSAVKKFEIGLCNPSYSTFLASNIPLQGINLELEKNNKFFAFTYGTTVASLLYNPNTLQGTIQGARNYYNYFDFGNLESGRKLLCMKGGAGGKEDTHLYAGFLIGKGRTDYLLVSPADHAPVAAGKESNLVLELDAKYKFSDQLSADFIAGKSSVKEEDLSADQLKRSVNEIFSGYRSYAFLSRLNWSLKPVKTKLTFTVRWVDPYFKSFGLGFLRSDNLRYEIKAEQPVTKKIKYTIAYRREEDNLLKLYDYKNVLQSISNTLSLKFSRYLNVRLIYAPLFRELRTDAYTISSTNYISTGIVSFIPKTKKVSAEFDLMYSRYIISGDSTKINFENMAYNQQFSFKSGFKTDLNISWFKNNMADTLGNDTYLAVADIGYAAKNNSAITVGGKAAYKKYMQPQLGFAVKATLKLYKGLYWDTEMERIIIGDYYDSFMIARIKKFPYYCSSRLTLNF